MRWLAFWFLIVVGALGVVAYDESTARTAVVWDGAEYLGRATGDVNTGGKYAVVRKDGVFMVVRIDSDRDWLLEVGDRVTVVQKVTALFGRRDEFRLGWRVR